MKIAGFHVHLGCKRVSINVRSTRDRTWGGEMVVFGIERDLSSMRVDATKWKCLESLHRGRRSPTHCKFDNCLCLKNLQQVYVAIKFLASSVDDFVHPPGHDFEYTHDFEWGDVNGELPPPQTFLLVVGSAQESPSLHKDARFKFQSWNVWCEH